MNANRSVAFPPCILYPSSTEVNKIPKRQEFNMTFNYSVPGQPELGTWPSTPEPPFHIDSCDRYRDGGPQGGTLEVVLADGNGFLYPFYFDRFLGRLCYGMYYDEESTFIQQGSDFEKEAFAIIEFAAQGHDQEKEILTHLERA